MTFNDNKYGKNRNLWRKTYPHRRRKPRNVTVLDDASDQYLTFDLNKLIRHRDYFVIDGPDIEPGDLIYEEGIVYFNNEDVVLSSFSSNFHESPIVVYTIESSGSDDNVNIYGIGQPTKDTFRIGASAPFSGSVRYRAIYSRNGYPVYIETSAYSSSFWVYAGKKTITNATEYTASYTINSGTLEYRDTAHDRDGNFDNDVFIETDTKSLTQATNTLSAPTTDTIHFIVTSK